MAWYNVNIFKKYALINIRPNTSFNLTTYSKTGFKNPMINFSYLYCIPNTNQWSDKLTLQGSYPEYKVISDPSINTSKSMIQVLVIEGD